MPVPANPQPDLLFRRCCLLLGRPHSRPRHLVRRSLAPLLLTACLTAGAVPEVEITAEPHHHLVFSNDQVRVFNVEIGAHAETLMHWHRHDYIYVQLGEAEVINAVKGKEPLTVKLHDGQTGFLPASFAHIARNQSDAPFRNVTIELLQDEKLRQANLHWKEDRGLEILPGGTQEILFVKDGIRASDFELQPHAAVPARSRSGPLLLVALTNLELFTNNLRTRTHQSRPRSTHLKPGETAWLAAGFRQPIVNAGQGSAEFVVLEFPAGRSD
jgi:Cupin